MSPTFYLQLYDPSPMKRIWTTEDLFEIYNHQCILLEGYLSTPTIGTYWSLWVVMAAHFHCYFWWRCLSDTLCATVIRLRWHSLSCYLQYVIVHFPLESHRYIYCRKQSVSWCFISNIVFWVYLHSQRKVNSIRVA